MEIEIKRKGKEIGGIGWLNKSIENGVISFEESFFGEDNKYSKRRKCLVLVLKNEIQKKDSEKESKNERFIIGALDYLGISDTHPEYSNFNETITDNKREDGMLFPYWTGATRRKLIEISEKWCREQNLIFEQDGEE